MNCAIDLSTNINALAFLRSSAGRQPASVNGAGIGGAGNLACIKLRSMKNTKNFSFTTPLLYSELSGGKLINHGELEISGCYEHYGNEINCVDIDEVKLGAADILPVLRWLGEGSVSEIEKIQQIAQAHVEGILQGQPQQLCDKYEHAGNYPNT